MSSDVDTGPSDGEGNDGEDAGYGAVLRPASPMDVDPPAPEGEPSGDKTGEEWRVVSETAADSAAALAAATGADADAHRDSSNGGSEDEEVEVEEEVQAKKKSAADKNVEEKDRDADDEREEEEEVDELEGGGVSDAAPALKKKGKIFESRLNLY